MSVEKWVKTYIEQVEYLKNNELQFLCNVFQDENCWLGVKLNNTVLGQRLTEEKIGEINNPLCRYNMACKYCVTDKIPQLFQEQLESYKSGFSSEEVDDDGKPATNNRKYVRNELLDAMKSVDPVFTLYNHVLWNHTFSNPFLIIMYYVLQLKGLLGKKYAEV